MVYSHEVTVLHTEKDGHVTEVEVEQFWLAHMWQFSNSAEKIKSPLSQLTNEAQQRKSETSDFKSVSNSSASG